MEKNNIRWHKRFNTHTQPGSNSILKLMLKTWPSCTDAESNLRDRVWGKVEKNRFITLTGKGAIVGWRPPKTVCPNLGGLVKRIIATV